MFCLITTIVMSAGSVFVADEATFVVPKNTKPFTVTKDEMVRIPAQGIAGSSITYDVNGPAKLIRVNNISERVGDRNFIGSSMKDAEIKPTGTGTVKVTVTVKPPNDPESKVTTYEFEVK
jgi:hypothetical protein